MTDTRVQHACTGTFFKSFKVKEKTRGAIVLDSGCGDGYAARAFVTHGAALVVAVDPYAAHNPKYGHDKIRWSSRELMVEKIYDIIWSHHVIEHIQDPINYLIELYFKLQDGGELWLTCPNTATTKNCVYSAGHLHNFNISNMVQCLRKAGYPIQDLRWYLTEGQLRIRIQKKGIQPYLFPKPFIGKLEEDIHFNVNSLPQIWRWQNAE